MKKVFTKRNIFIVIVLFLGVAQFFKIDKNNPAVSSDQDYISLENPPKSIATMLMGQCYDCHSNETKYPWYMDYAPVSWWLKSNVNGAREVLNFSEWGTYSEKEKIAKKLLSYEALKEGEMPVALYVMMHEEAQFSDEQIDSLAAWFNSEK